MSLCRRCEAMSSLPPLRTSVSAAAVAGTGVSGPPPTPPSISTEPAPIKGLAPPPPAVGGDNRQSVASDGCLRYRPGDRVSLVTRSEWVCGEADSLGGLLFWLVGEEIDGSGIKKDKRSLVVSVVSVKDTSV